MQHFSDLMVAIYIDLDRLIESTPLTKNQRLTVKFMMDGYNAQDLSELWRLPRQRIDTYLRQAAVKMARLNSQRYWETIERKYHNRMVG